VYHPFVVQFLTERAVPDDSAQPQYPVAGGNCGAAAGGEAQWTLARNRELLLVDASHRT
jgi:hypothetical protein